MRQSLNKQKGHAAILFALLIPGFYGLFALGIDGARAIQNRARLGDAAEVAALALSAQNSTSSQHNTALARLYVDAYIRDKETNVPMNIVRTECQLTDQTQCEGGARYSQYDISITTTHESWFPGNENFVGLDEKYSVSHASTARKYQGDSIDIAFVTDFSGSMDYWWGTKRKYQEVQDIISNVLVELDKFNQESASPDELNKVALVPFAAYSVDAVGGRCNGSWSKRKIYYSDQIVYGWNDKQSAKNTVVDLWQVKESDERCDYVTNYDYYTTPLTSDLNSIDNDIKSFSPEGGTASYQGIMRAAQILKATNTPNPRRLIVILSDGDDNNSDMASALVEEGMCTEIIDGLSSDRTVSGRPVTAQLALIGFTYDVNDNRALADCVGESNVYDASNPDELLEIILNLISEEIGHIK
ncbi:hypothetical protein AB4291_11935 [Vibrio cyclitrophicus]|uniref:pilus assembly protein n=1 Tax=Vibrio cyclitrophicus TaxID=47951 RepID=UPI000C81C6EB|nr:pilus assembly protein [Vibrio cyclitrophicus]PMG13878.1 hypothetical protein BCU99_12170 [Vibrio cyclitrophicus]